MVPEGRQRVVIENVKPEIDGGRFPARRVAGEKVSVQADIFADGHEEIAAMLLFRKAAEKKWSDVPMRPLMNDRWEASFTVEEMGVYTYTLQGWVDHFKTWQKDLQKKFKAGQDVSGDLLIGSTLVERSAERAHGADRNKLASMAASLREGSAGNAAGTVSLALDESMTRLVNAYPDRSLATFYARELFVEVDREKALFSTWYEMFPRSCSPESGKHGGFKDCAHRLPEIARMGFDVLYLPPIHPIGKTNRKGKNNSAVADPDAPGSPWAIGAEEGGHKSVHPFLGTMEDFALFMADAGKLGLEIALDLAFQCTPDHPYIREHPEWFRWRPDGTIQYAENPPKKYEDIVPFDFETDDWKNLWEELKSIVFFWIGKGVRIFRVDNPHTKPFAFWEWLIRGVKGEHPDVIFLSEAFTRPKVMYRLAKAGFTQSYTYITWRNTRQELTEYVEELTRTEVREYFRPNFWPNTPDILHDYLQHGGRPAFIARIVLAATLSSNYGIYGPAYELMVSEALPDREEYRDSEKYEIKNWDRTQPGALNDFIVRLNRIRRENAALRVTRNVRFHETDNDQVIFYVKVAEELSDVLLIAVNLDPFRRQVCRVRVPLEELGIPARQTYLVHDLLSEDKYLWQGEWNSLDLDPRVLPAAVLRVHSRMRREQDFDYFM